MPEVQVCQPRFPEFQCSKGSCSRDFLLSELPHTPGFELITRMRCDAILIRILVVSEEVELNCKRRRFHLYLMGDPPEALKRLQNKIINIHFSDCDGKVHGDLPPGRGVVPLKKYLAALRDIGVECPVSIELQWPSDPNKIREWVFEAYSQTAKMMDELGVRG